MFYSENQSFRRSLRIKHHNYERFEVYFMTLYTHERACLLGDINQGLMQLNQWGQIVAQTWEQSNQDWPDIQLDRWVVMPNHFHAIVVVDRNAPLVAAINGTATEPRWPMPSAANQSDSASGIAMLAPPLVQPVLKPRSLSWLIADFKSSVTQQINALRGNAPGLIWQAADHEYKIQDAVMWHHTRAYIDRNPGSWEEDCLHPANAEI
jgi:putative transposase